MTEIDKRPSAPDPGNIQIHVDELWNELQRVEPRVAELVTLRVANQKLQSIAQQLAMENEILREGESTE